MKVVYAIRNTVNNNIYIGSSVGLDVRMRMHKHQLRKNKHHSLSLQKDWNKFNESDFKCEIIEYVSDSTNHVDREQVWINFFNPEYNTATNAASPMKGRKHSYGCKKQMAAAHTGKKWGFHTEESKLRQSQLKNHIKRKISQVTVGGEVIATFESIEFVAKHFKRTPQAIGRALRFKTKSCNFFWRDAT